MTFTNDKMTALSSPIAEATTSASRIENQIELRAGGRIRDLHVVFEEGRIVLTGRSRTYHAKQLALQVVLEHMNGPTLLANQIVVS